MRLFGLPIKGNKSFLLLLGLVLAAFAAAEYVAYRGNGIDLLGGLVHLEAK